jgi:hypothetical protein
MRYRTAAVLSLVLIGGVFGLPEAIKVLFLPSLEYGNTTPVPAYERMLLGIAIFCLRFMWLLALPIAVVVVVLFAVAGITSAARTRTDGAHPHPKTTVAASNRNLGIGQASPR